MTASTRQRIENALWKSLQWGHALKQVGWRHYRIKPDPQDGKPPVDVDYYTVRIVEDAQNVWREILPFGISCTCVAGQNGAPCYHAAKLAIQYPQGRAAIGYEVVGNGVELFDEDDGEAEEHRPTSIDLETGEMLDEVSTKGR
jgi:hypothetical protein